MVSFVAIEEDELWTGESSVVITYTGLDVGSQSCVVTHNLL